MEASVIGSWIVERPLKRGGMGEVYAARHKTLGTPAAIKVLRPEHANVDEFRKRFEVEAQTQARLRHPSIARVLDYMEKDGAWYLVMEYLEAGSLRDELNRVGGPLPADDVLDWAIEALEGLSFVHGAGIVHRDLKPDNILLNEHRRAVVTDFGIARVAEGPQMTATGMTLGTPAYMSPEQLTRPNEIDARTDVFAMGVVIYELLSGQLPFGSGPDSVYRQLEGRATPLLSLRPDLSPEIGKVLALALHRDPRQRFANGGELLRALQLARSGSGSSTTGALMPSPLPTGPVALHPSGLSTLVQASSSGTLSRPVAQEVYNAPPVAIARRPQRGWIGPALAALVFGGVCLAMMDPFKESPQKSPLIDPVPTDPGGEKVDPSPPPANNDPVAPTHEKRSSATQSLRPTKPGKPEAPVPNGAQNQELLRQQMERAMSPPSGMPNIQPQPQPLPPLPQKPVVAVISSGEPLLATSLEEQLENRLRLAGYDVRDELNSFELAERASAGKRVTARDAPLLVKEGFHVLVVLSVVEGRGQKVEFRQLSTQAFASQARLNAVLLLNGTPIGRGWSELIEYTEMSAQAKAERSLIGPTADLIDEISKTWSRLPKG